jgi:S-methylmethionine-dependent homocysteine/selenocysteine methylase
VAFEKISQNSVTLLDGPLGTELEARGIPTPLPLWSAAAVMDHPDAVVAIHEAFALAGADVHTTATFRTTARALAQAGCSDSWTDLATRAVALCRQGVGSAATVAGSLAPLEDCWHPERTPDTSDLEREHLALAQCLADGGADMLLVETMPTERELVAATAAAASTGLPVWSAITLGPQGDFFTGDTVRQAASVAAAAGAEAFMINCTPADAITPLLQELATLDDRPRRVGAYGNTLFGDEQAWSPERYAIEVSRWIASGATIIGGCCGTGPQHVAALRQLILQRST